MANDTTPPLPSFQEPVVDGARRWGRVWRRWVEPLWKTTRSNTRAITEVSGDVTGLGVTVTELSEVIEGSAEDLDAIVAQWGVAINLDGHVIGLVRLDAALSSSTFTVVADKFVISRPGSPGTTIQAFIVGNVAGVTTVGLNGNLVVDDTIIARHIAVDELAAVSADVGTLTAGVARSADASTVIDLDNEILQITTGTRRLRYEGGAIAVYDVPSATSTDNAPLTAPNSNISRLHFHSSQPAPSIIKTSGTFRRTGSIVLGAQAANTVTDARNVLFAHGRSGTPIVYGRLNINGGAWISLSGSIPLILKTGDPAIGAGRWAHLGADATNVVLVTTSIGLETSPLVAMTVNWEIYVTDITVENGQDAFPDTRMLGIESGFFVAGGGKFDSRRRYIRSDPGATDFKLLKSKTLDITRSDVNVGFGTESRMSMRYSVGAFVQSNGPAPSSFNATYEDATFEGGAGPPAGESFLADAGRIRAWEADGSNVFDTDQRNLIWTDFASGSIVVPYRESTSQFGTTTISNVDADTVLASINPAADIVFGAFRVNSTGGGYFADTGWFQATGTYRHRYWLHNGSGAISGGQPTTPWTGVAGAQAYTFRASGGSLIFNERTLIIVIPEFQGSILGRFSGEATTVDYRLYCGTLV